MSEILTPEQVREMRRLPATPHRIAAVQHQTIQALAASHEALRARADEAERERDRLLKAR